MSIRMKIHRSGLWLAAALLCGVVEIGGMLHGGNRAHADAPASTMITGILANSDLGAGYYLLEARGDREITVNAVHALANHLTAVLIEGRAYTVIGTLNASGELEATSIARAKNNSRAWPDDR